MAKGLYAKKLYLKAGLKWWGMFFAMVTVLVLDFKYGIGKTDLSFKAVELFIAVLFGFALYPLIAGAFKKIKSVEDGSIKESGAAKLGADGEEAVGEWLREVLPEKSYRILKNFTLPGCKFDIDFVIVGPKGVIIFEVKNLANQVTFSDDEYFQMVDGKKQVLPFEWDPRTQIKQHAYLLRKHFENCGYYNLIILKAVVFPKDDSVNLAGKPGVYIINGRENLTNYLNRATILTEYTKDLCQKLVDCLELK